MFENFTEQARRAIFFARYEASKYGSAIIDPEHLLLGLTHRNKDLLIQLIVKEGAVRQLWEALSNESLITGIRERIEARITIQEKIPTSIDISFSHGSERILAYAAEEAECLKDSRVRPEHILLGILREEKCVVATILCEYGVQLDALRERVSHLQAQR